MVAYLTIVGVLTALTGLVGVLSSGGVAPTLSGMLCVLIGGSLLLGVAAIVGELRTMNRNALLLRLHSEEWEGEVDGVKYRVTGDGRVQALTATDFKTFDSRERFDRFLKKRRHQWSWRW